MKARTKVVLAMLVGLAFVVPVVVVAAGNGGGGNGNGGKPKNEYWKEARERRQERWQERIERRQELMERMRERFMEKWRQHKHIGHISYENGTVLGVFVSFDLDENTGTILDYTLRHIPDSNGTAIFESISVEGAGAARQLWTRGSVARFGLGNVSVSAHDNPTGLLMLKSEGNNTITIQVAEGFETDIMRSSNRGTHILGLNGSIKGVLIVSHGNTTLDNNTITISLQDEGRIVFLARPQREEAYEYIAEGIANGTIGAEIRIGKGRWIDKVLLTNIDIETTYDSTTGTITLNIASDEEQGKILVVIVDNETVAQSGLKIIYDGNEIRRVEKWKELLDALKTNESEGGEAVYMIRPCDGGYYIFIAVPHFSEHTIVIQGAAEIVKPIAIGAVFAGVAVVAVAATVMFRRRRWE